MAEMKQAKKCPITGSEMRPLFRHRVLGKYDVDYYYCDQSGIIQTEEAYWLEEAYQSVISELDTWIAVRNFGNAGRLEPILSLLFPPDSIFVDVACGYGILTRLMRDRGFEFFGYDKYCPNIFSKPFSPPAGTKASAVCAFEVMEHLMDPVRFLREQLSLYGADTILASTTVFEDAVPALDWVYYSFESGQHLTFYQPRSLELIARSLHCTYVRLSSDLHLITRRRFASWKLFVLRAWFVRRAHVLLTSYLRRGLSLTAPDYETLRCRILGSSG